MKRLGIAAVPHGFRSSFRDWCGETGVEFAVSEKCLAHSVGNQVTEAYARSSLFNRRVKVMEDWAEYVCSPSTERDARAFPTVGCFDQLPPSGCSLVPTAAWYAAGAIGPPPRAFRAAAPRVDEES